MANSPKITPSEVPGPKRINSRIGNGTRNSRRQSDHLIPHGCRNVLHALGAKFNAGVRKSGNAQEHRRRAVCGGVDDLRLVVVDGLLDDIFEGVLQQEIVDHDAQFCWQFEERRVLLRATSDGASIRLAIGFHPLEILRSEFWSPHLRSLIWLAGHDRR